MPRGGKRPNSGPKKGAKYAPTMAKEQAREVARALIMQHFAPMIQAQVSHALGLKYLVTRDKKTGKFVRVTEAMARHKQDDADSLETIEVWEKDPSVQAFTDLMNRALDKPKEQEQTVTLSGTIDIVTVLRKRFDRHQPKPE